MSKLTVVKQQIMLEVNTGIYDYKKIHSAFIYPGKML